MSTSTMSSRPRAARVSATIRAGASGNRSSGRPRSISSASSPRIRCSSPDGAKVRSVAAARASRLLADVGLETDGHVVVAVDLGRKAMDVDDLLVALRIDADRIELLELVAHGDDHVGVVEAEIDIVVAHEPDRAEGLGVVVGKDPLAVERGGHRDAERVRRSGEGCRRLGRGWRRVRPARSG